jgi:hypothetical protein
MANWVAQRDRTAWDAELAERLLEASDREAALADRHCPNCKRRLLAEPREFTFWAGVELTEVTALRCPRCQFAAAVGYHEIYVYDWGRAVTIDGRVVREAPWDRPSHERLASGEAGGTR